MTRTQLLLAKLAEEGVEVAQIALKAQQFGLTEIRPGQPLSNAQRIHLELDDLMAQIEMLNECGLDYVPNRDHIEAKKRKVDQFAALSVRLGQVVDHSEQGGLR